MKARKLFAAALLSLLLVGCDNGGQNQDKPGDEPGQEEHVAKPIKIMTMNLDQAHVGKDYYLNRAIKAISSVRPDLIGVQEENAGWQSALEPALEEYGFKRYGENRGGSFPEASGIYINMDRFSVVEYGTKWFGDSATAGSGYIASEWGAALPRIVTWAHVKDRVEGNEISFFNAHLEYNHPYGTMNGEPTETDNTIECRKKSCEQVIKMMKDLDLPGIFVGDLNSWREKEPTVYNTCLEYFDDAWAKDENSKKMCTFQNYGVELKEETRQHPYSPIDYVYTTKDKFTINSYNIMDSYEGNGTKEEDFDSDHFWVNASISYKKDVQYGPEEKPEEPTPATHTCGHKCATCGLCTDTTCTDAVCANKCQGHQVVNPGENKLKVMSCNLDQAEGSNATRVAKVLKCWEDENPDLIGVQEETSAWTNSIQSTMESRGYTHIVKSRGGSYPEASGIFIKNSRFDIISSETFWFGKKTTTEGYIATEWGAAFPRICTWALLKDKQTNQQISFFNAHLEYNHARGNMNADPTDDNNTIECRLNSCKQVIGKMKAAKAPGIFVGDLNSFRELEPTVYNECLSYFDDAWALTPDKQEMCSWHDYGNQLGTKGNYPDSPMDYVYSTKGKFHVDKFTIMGGLDWTQNDFMSDHFFVKGELSY